MNATIGIADNYRQSVAMELSKILADEYILYAKTRNAHWNVEGPGFLEMHKFFESQFEQLDDFIDRVAERIRTLGHYALPRWNPLQGSLSISSFRMRSSWQTEDCERIHHLTPTRPQGLLLVAPSGSSKQTSGTLQSCLFLCRRASRNRFSGRKTDCSL